MKIKATLSPEEIDQITLSMSLGNITEGLTEEQEQVAREAILLHFTKAKKLGVALDLVLKGIVQPYYCPDEMVIRLKRTEYGESVEDDFSI